MKSGPLSVGEASGLPDCRTDLARWLSGSALLAFSASAVCQGTSPPPPSPATQQLAPVSVSGRKDVGEGSGTRTVFQGEELRRFGDPTLADSLRRIPGISATVNPDGTLDIRLRGMGSGYTQILLDGLPPPRGFAIESLDLQSIERLEVVRVSSADTSARGVAGTINIVLKKAGAGQSNSAKVSVGTEHDRPQADVSGQWNAGTPDLRYGATYSLGHELHVRDGHVELDRADDTGTASYRGTTRDELRFDAASVNPNVVWHANDRTTLSAAATYRWSDLADRTGQKGAFNSLLPFPNSDFELTGTTTFWQLSSTVVHSLEDFSRVEFRLAASRNVRNRSTMLVGSSDAGEVLLNRQIDSRLTDQVVVHRGSYQPIELLGPGHVVKIGYDAELTTRTEVVENVRYLVGTGPNIGGLFSASIDTLATFAQDEWQPYEALLVNAGIRTETTRIRAADPADVDVGTTKTILAPSIKATWQLGSPDRQLHLSASKTIRQPSPRQIIPRRYFSNNNSPVEPDYVGNPQLRAETAWGVDALLEINDRPVSYSVGAFLQRVNDVIVEETSLVDGLWTQSPRNLGPASVAGLTLGFKSNVRKWAADAPDVDIKANLGRNWSAVDRVERPNNRIATQTPTTATVALDYRGSAAFTAGIAFSLQTGGTTWTTNQTAVYRGVRRSLDVFAVRRLDKESRIRFSLTNALAQAELEGTAFQSPGFAETRLASTHTNRAVRIALEANWR